MKKFLIVLMVIILAMDSCEKQDPFPWTTQDAKIIDFVTEKCYCCWGWVIEIDKSTIKSLAIKTSQAQADETYPGFNNLTVEKKTI